MTRINLLSENILVMHDDVIKWQHFRVGGPLCGESAGHRWYPPLRPLTRGFVIFFDLRLSKRLSKQSRRRWFETPKRSLWRHSGWNATESYQPQGYETSVLHAILHADLTHLPTGQNIRDFADDIFRCIFVDETVCLKIKISLKLVPRVPIDN